MKNMNRARLTILASATAVLAVVGCDRVKTELLAPQNPGLVDPSAVSSPTAALALRVGAIGRYKQVQSGESIWEYAGTLADEFKNQEQVDLRKDPMIFHRIESMPINGSQTPRCSGITTASRSRAVSFATRFRR